MEILILLLTGTKLSLDLGKGHIKTRGLVKNVLDALGQDIPKKSTVQNLKTIEDLITELMNHPNLITATCLTILIKLLTI